MGLRDVRLCRGVMDGRVSGLLRSVERHAVRKFTLSGIVAADRLADGKSVVYERNLVKLRLFLALAVVFVVCAAAASFLGGWTWDEGKATAAPIAA